MFVYLFDSLRGGWGRASGVQLFSESILKRPCARVSFVLLFTHEAAPIERTDVSEWGWSVSSIGSRNFCILISRPKWEAMGKRGKKGQIRISGKDLGTLAMRGFPPPLLDTAQGSARDSISGIPRHLLFDRLQHEEGCSWVIRPAWRTASVASSAWRLRWKYGPPSTQQIQFHGQ